ncbi:MAG: long-chain N-acyl amino acid synthase [Burkholderiales bacterium]|nr:long-chain N-acyl amino acid synthase [Burkholderiales bacterium]
MTGLTVFDDIALRLRNLTTEQLDASKGDPGALPGAFKIRLAKSRTFRKGAGTLVERRYAHRGYQTPQQNEDPNLFTFVAYDEGALVGTVSIRLDSPAGLSADALYKEEIDDLRKAGCKVCEFTRLAVDVKAVSKPVLAGLFHTAYLYASAVRGYNFAVIEVNPRHVAFYAKALGFEPIGPERTNTRVNAPAVLLCVPFEHIAVALKKYAGDPEAVAKSRSLFPYGFPPEEESGILGRLRELDTSRADAAPRKSPAR